MSKNKKSQLKNWDFIIYLVAKTATKSNNLAE